MRTRILIYNIVCRPGSVFSMSACADSTFQISRGDVENNTVESGIRIRNKTTKNSANSTFSPFFFFCRLDFSLVELLDVFSPVSASERPRRPKSSQRRLIAPKPAGKTLLTPAGSYPPSTQQDLEESQILEDIFFIC